MLEVHAPHTAIHGWRDFLLHIATITIGLLIAIGLEQTVEHFHHRHLLHQARENLREEIQQNQKLLIEDRRFLESNRKTMLHNLATLRQLKANPRQPRESIAFPWQWSSPSAAAWNTARDTGALALMPYDDVQNYSTLYSQQDRVNDQANVYIANQNHANIPLVGLSDNAILQPAEIDELIHACATADADMNLLENFMKSLDQNYTDALKQLD
jgi:hypothetical protein